jgi:zinc protease
VEARLGGWKGTPGQTPAPADPKAQPAEVTLVHRADAPQSQLRIGHLGVARNNPDYFPLILCNAVLGGMFNSRINMMLREQKGYTYDARSQFGFARAPGDFVVSTGVRTDVTAPAIQDVLAEIERMRKTDVTAEELQHAKNSYSLSLPGMFQNASRVASMMGGLFVYDLPLDYYQTLPQNLSGVSVADVRRVADAHLKPEQLSIVVVGDESKVGPSLSQLGRGPVVKRTVTGAKAP